MCEVTARCLYTVNESKLNKYHQGLFGSSGEAHDSLGITRDKFVFFSEIKFKYNHHSQAQTTDRYVPLL